MRRWADAGIALDVGLIRPKVGDTIGFEGRFDYAAIGTVSNVASRLCDEAKPGQILISPRVLMAVKDAVTVEPVGEFELKGIRRPVAAYNVLAVSRLALTGLRLSAGGPFSSYRTAYALEVLCAEVFHIKEIAEELPCALSDDHRVRLSDALKACGEVRCLTNNGLLLSSTRSDQIADHH
jgi:hypothetical protein